MVAAGVLISGAGTNLQAIIDRIGAGRLDCSLRVVISNRPAAPGLARAQAAGVPTRVIEHGHYARREDFDRAVVEVLQGARVELVLLAGFDRLLTPVLLKAFPHRIMNVHPALLPAFKGLHAQRQALEYGVKFSGCTVHLVDENLDAGPILAQSIVPVRDDDTSESLSARILIEEHRIYTDAVRLLLSGNYRIEGRRVIALRQQP